MLQLLSSATRGGYDSFRNLAGTLRYLTEELAGEVTFWEKFRKSVRE